MKKLLSAIIVTVFLLICINNSYAQGGKIGLKGGVAAYNLTVEIEDIEISTERKIGFEAGLFGNFPVSEIISIQPEVLFTQKGGKVSSDLLENSSATLNYIDVPVLLKLDVPLDGTVKPYIISGPYAGYLITATSDTEGEGEDVTEFIEDINYGLKLGLGVSIGSFVIDARIDVGLANLTNEDEEVSEFGDFEVTTSGVVLSMGIFF